MDLTVARLLSLLGCLLLLLESWTVSGKKMKKSQRFMECGSCIAMVDEVGWHIAMADPKKKVQIGSFRIDARGDQNTHEIPYARSEVHLIEVMERVCRGMHNYIVYHDPDTKTKYWIRKSSRDGVEISKKNTMESEELSKLLRFKCEALVEAYEEDIIRIFKETKEDREADKIICVEVAELCREKDLETWLMVQGRAVMAGMKEAQEKIDEEKAKEAGIEERETLTDEEYDPDKEAAADEELAREQELDEEANETGEGQEFADNNMNEDPVTPAMPTDTESKDEL